MQLHQGHLLSMGEWYFLVRGQLLLSQQVSAAMPCHEWVEKETRSQWQILQIDPGTLTPLLSSINGSMGEECQKFYSRLA